MTTTDVKGLPIAEVFARRLREIRDQRDWSQQQLAERMNELGFTNMDRSTVLKIEQQARPEKKSRTGKGITPRKVSLEEAIGFAAALGVSPVDLLLPAYPFGEHDAIKVAPRVVLPVPFVLAWLHGLTINRQDVSFSEGLQGAASKETSPQEKFFDLIEEALVPTPDDRPTMRHRLSDEERDLLLSTESAREAVRAYIEGARRGVELARATGSRFLPTQSEAREAAIESMRVVTAEQSRRIDDLEAALNDYEQGKTTKTRRKR
jgi:transcriptional regulator with XRE-family HTH domain